MIYQDAIDYYDIDKKSMEEHFQTIVNFKEDEFNKIKKVIDNNIGTAPYEKFEALHTYVINNIDNDLIDMGLDDLIIHNSGIENDIRNYLLNYKVRIEELFSNILYCEIN